MSTIQGRADSSHSAIGIQSDLDVDDTGGPIPHDTGGAAGIGDDRSVTEPVDVTAVDTTSPDGLESPDAFVRRLYDQHARRLLSFVLKVNGGDWQWGEDVVQETMLRAWRHAAALQSSGSPNLMPWLTTVARRIVLNDQRSRRTRPMEVGDTLLALVTVQDDTERALQHAVLEEALAELTPAQRQAVVEKYYWSRTGDEMARALGIPAGTVKSRIHYALRMLRTILSERGMTA
jgi:RNA polymerase sigma-70 factor, ECF subfamily